MYFLNSSNCFISKNDTFVCYKKHYKKKITKNILDCLNAYSERLQINRYGMFIFS